MAGCNDNGAKVAVINQIHFIGEMVEVNNADALKKLCGDLKNYCSSRGEGADVVIVLATNVGGKPFVTIAIAENVVATKGLDAGQIIKQQVAPLIKGGGGQKFLATAGGQDASILKNVIDAVRRIIV